MGLHSKNQIKQAFTMAEAILVMTILGIIATIMITTLKPAEFKEKALATLAKKVLSEIDTATTQILINDTKDGTFKTIIASDGTAYDITSTDNDTYSILSELYRKYLTTLRMDWDVTNATTVANAGHPWDSSFVRCVYYSYRTDAPPLAFKLKDGSFVCISSAASFGSAQETIIPGEAAPCVSSGAIGYLIFDANGELEQPNTLGKDVFVLPIDSNGIAYDMACD